MGNVVVGLSGGVDSAYACYLLKEMGFSVFGCYLKFCETPLSKIQLLSAKRISEIFSIPFFILDCRKIFEKRVVNYFVKEYKNGRTPNPCVICNELVKFPVLIKFAKEKKAIVATGHYAKISKYNEKFILCEAKDKMKDQSYFLYRLKQFQLKNIIFPLGDVLKEEISKFKIFKDLEFPPESQDICFLTNKNYRIFLKEKLPHLFKEGLIVDERGNILGKHSGIVNYTVGQRRGLKIYNKAPYYVKRILALKNIIVVSRRENLLRQSFYITNCNWILDPLSERKLEVKIRYKAIKKAAKVKKIKNNIYLVILSEPYQFITPGQSAVFYSEEKVIGGGLIKC